ncbi:unnamed protein product, partial [Cylindrotheca closterium]
SDHRTRGQSFWDQLTGLPHQDSLIHDHIINSRRGMRLDKTIHQSFGHPVTDTTKPGYQVTCPEDFEPEDQRMEELEQLFDQWNDPTLTFAQRMRNGETMSPGFALLVRKGEDGQPCHIMFISNPVLTKPDVMEPNTFGAPAPFGEIVNNDIAQKKTIIENWFNAVKASPASFAVPVVDALPFWSCFPTEHDPVDARVLDVALLAPFQEQMDRFLRSHLMQLIYRSGSLPTSTLGFKMRAWVRMHNMRLAESYPTALGITLPPECQAFVNYLFPFEDEDKGWDGRIPKWYKTLDLDSGTEVPDSYLQYTPRPLPSSAQDPDDYVTQRLTVPPVAPPAALQPMDDDLAEFLQATKRHKPNSRRSPVHPPVTPAPEDSFVLTEEGNFEDGHGTNYVPHDDPGGMQPRTDGQVLPAVTPSPSTYRPLDHVAPSHTSFPSSRDQHPDSSCFRNPSRGNPFAGVMNGTNIPLQSPAQGMPHDGIHDSTWNSPFQQGPRVRIDSTPRGPSPFAGHCPTTSPAMGLPTPVHHHQMFPASPGLPMHHMYPHSHMPMSYQPGYDGTMYPMSHYPTHPTFHTNKPNSRSKYTPMRSASINSEMERRCCPPELKAIGYWLVHPLPPTVGVVRTSLGDRAATDVLQFGLPTAIGRRCLEGFDYKNDGQVAVNIVCTALEYRIKHQFGSFSQVGELQRDLRSVMNSDFVKSSYNIATWGVDPDNAPPPGTSKRFSLLAFLPCVLANLSSEYLPRDGLTWQQMKEF